MIQFGLSSLKGYTNGISSGAALTMGAGSTGSAVIATGHAWIGGILCTNLSTGIDLGAAAGVNTGLMMVYAFMSATNASGTASVSYATGSSSILLNYPDIGTDIAVLGKFTYGTGGANGDCTDLSTSGFTGLKTFGKAQNCSLNVTYDQVIARGGTLVFGNDMKHYNGNIEGTLEMVDFTGENIAHILGSTWASGGAGCGTMTLTATDQPVPFMIQTQQVTDGITSTVQLLKCYSNSITMNLDRENYLQPTLGFQAIANIQGSIMKILST